MFSLTQTVHTRYTYQTDYNTTAYKTSITDKEYNIIIVLAINRVNKFIDVLMNEIFIEI